MSYNLVGSKVAPPPTIKSNTLSKAYNRVSQLFQKNNRTQKNVNNVLNSLIKNRIHFLDKTIKADENNKATQRAKRKYINSLLSEVKTLKGGKRKQSRRTRKH
jgi:hypothetical protein